MWLERIAAQTEQDAESMPSRTLRAQALFGVGVFSSAQGDFNMATACLEQGVTLFQQLGDSQAVAATTRLLGEIAVDMDNLVAGLTLLEKSLALARGLDDKRLIALSLNGFGDLARVQGDEGQAMKFYEESVGLFGEIEDLWWSATVICNTGYVALRQGDLALAAKRFSDSLQFYREYGDKVGIGLCILGFASEASLHGAYERAARLFAAALGLFEVIGMTLERKEEIEYERGMAAVHAQLDDMTFRAAWAEGRAMTLEQAIAYALKGEG